MCVACTHAVLRCSVPPQLTANQAYQIVLCPHDLCTLSIAFSHHIQDVVCTCGVSSCLSRAQKVHSLVLSVFFFLPSACKTPVQARNKKSVLNMHCALQSFSHPDLFLEVGLFMLFRLTAWGHWSQVLWIKAIYLFRSRLSGFQNHLGSISGEIKHLQDESLSMNVKLTNRKVSVSPWLWLCTSMKLENVFAWYVLMGDHGL